MPDSFLALLGIYAYLNDVTRRKRLLINVAHSRAEENGIQLLVANNKCEIRLSLWENPESHL